ncbi:uncharacterized protein LOC135168740 isoform X2 [Diachasmimorpha longicaudata]|uniref:uncharacterized protein LOC135168740 isoform X2 n=1 Tax=Diachasmimorpha longicaudata TaxID=58733 RepID=UPI0030B8E9D8
MLNFRLNSFGKWNIPEWSPSKIVDPFWQLQRIPDNKCPPIVPHPLGIVDGSIINQDVIKQQWENKSGETQRWRPTRSLTGPCIRHHWWIHYGVALRDDGPTSRQMHSPILPPPSPGCPGHSGVKEGGRESSVTSGASKCNISSCQVPTVPPISHQYSHQHPLPGATAHVMTFSHFWEYSRGFLWKT